MSRTADPATSGRVVVPAAGVPTAAALPDDVEACYVDCGCPTSAATPPP